MTFRRSQGFTLLELMVSMLLLSVVFLLLASGLHFGTKVWRTADNTEAGSDRRAIQSLLRTLLTSARPVMIETSASEPPHIFFDGSGNALEFVTTLPPHIGIGGFYDVRISSLEGDRMAIAWRILRDRQSQTLPLEWHSLLVNKVVTLQFSYFGSRDASGKSAWSANWQSGTHLPDLIAMRVRTEDSDWPELVVAPTIQAVNFTVPRTYESEGQ